MSDMKILKISSNSFLNKHISRETRKEYSFKHQKRREELISEARNFVPGILIFAKFH